MTRFWRLSSLILLCYLLLAVVMTWPVAAQMGTHLPGGSDDLWSHQWTFWWIKRCLETGQNPFYTSLLFHPVGVSLANHNIAWINIALWLPLQAIVGSTTAYSLIFLAVFALNGFAAFLLAHKVTSSLPAAFIGGLAYGFWPYVLSHYGQPNMMMACWLPLALLFLQRTLDQGQKRDALVSAIFLALTGLGRWQMLVMGSFLIGLYALYRVLGEKACRNRRSLGLLALIVITAGVLMLPFAAPVAVAQLSREYPEDLFISDPAKGQTDLLAYVLPSRSHPLWRDTLLRVYDNFVDNKVYVAFLGYIPILLALYGTVKNWKQARFWLAAALMYIALALGPQLRVNGQILSQIPMPYRLIGNVPLIQLVRNPDRFNVILGLAVGMLVSLGTEALLRSRLLGRRPILVVSAISVLILREFSLTPYPTASTFTPAWYDQLAQEPESFAVLDLPMQPETFDKHYMFYQITHGKPLVEGKVARPPREAFSFIDSVAFLSALRKENTMDTSIVNLSYQLRTLADTDIRYIVIHRNLVGPEQLAAWRDWLTVEPTYEGPDLLVYSTDPRLDSDYSLAHRLTDEIGIIRATVEPSSTIQGALAHIDVRWGSMTAPGRDYDVCFSMTNLAHTGDSPQSTCWPLSPNWPTSHWGAEEIVRSTYVLHIDGSLEPGRYSLISELKDPTTGRMIGDPVTWGHVEVEPLQPAFPLQATWADAVLLHGFDLRESIESLELTVYWQALQEMDISYKVFVHLIDPASGRPVVQDDAVPRRWTYPTTEWTRNEVVDDMILLPLDGVPQGRYNLVIGLYDPETEDRLPAFSAQGSRYPDDAVPLITVER
jgi:hypothetical protein